MLLQMELCGFPSGFAMILLSVPSQELQLLSLLYLSQYDNLDMCFLLRFVFFFFDTLRVATPSELDFVNLFD